MYKFSVPSAIVSGIFYLNWLTFVETMKKIYRAPFSIHGVYFPVALSRI